MLIDSLVWVGVSNVMFLFGKLLEEWDSSYLQL